MSNRGRVGIPTSRTETDFLEIHPDGSIDVRSRLREAFGRDPVRVLVGMAATIIVAENENRRAVDIYNKDVTTIYIGFKDTITVNDGMPILPYVGKVIQGYTGDVYGVSTVIDVDVRVLEMNNEEEEEE